MSTSTVLDEIAAERNRQRSLWLEEHDDLHSISEWITLVAAYLGKAADEAMRCRPLEVAVRRRLVQASAVCIAAIEAMDRRDSKP
jgi:hypothetical protein